MAERRSLMEGLKTATPADNAAENAFVYNKKSDAAQPTSPTVTLNRVPISTRMREDFAKALKRASLERQLDGTEPNTLQNILEAALEPWLKGNGYLS